LAALNVARFVVHVAEGARELPQIGKGVSGKPGAGKRGHG
jgi:hypothetical protein